MGTIVGAAEQWRPYHTAQSGSPKMLHAEHARACWRPLTTISRRQFDQKIMRVCISYTHLYPNKFLNHTSPCRKCKMCFWANMQVASTLWPSIKLQKIPEHRFRLKWTKCSPRTQFKPLKTGRDQHGSDKGGQKNPLEESWGLLAPRAGRPTRPMGPPHQLCHMVLHHWSLRSVSRVLARGSLL